MKKIMTLLFSFTICMAMCISFAGAVECENVGVSVSYESIDMDAIDMCNELDFGYAHTTQRASGYHDLSESSKRYNWSIDAGSYETSEYYYKTNTRKIYASVGTDLYDDAYLNVELLDENGTSLAEHVFTYHPADERTPVITFTNLSASKWYQIKISNLGQKKLTVSGIIKQ